MIRLEIKIISKLDFKTSKELRFQVVNTMPENRKRFKEEKKNIHTALTILFKILM